jgi:hypothetical protein
MKMSVETADGASLSAETAGMCRGWGGGLHRAGAWTPPLVLLLMLHLVSRAMVLLVSLVVSLVVSPLVSLLVFLSPFPLVVLLVLLSAVPSVLLFVLLSVLLLVLLFALLYLWANLYSVGHCASRSGDALYANHF